MLSDLQIISLLNLKSSVIDYVDVSRHKSGNTYVTVSGVENAEPEEIFTLIKSIVAEFEGKEDILFYASDDRTYSIHESAGVKVHLKKEKAPAEAEENTHLDNTTVEGVTE